MRIITWNCWGLGKGPAIRGLLDVQKREAPDILFLSETKHDEKWMEWLKWKLELTNLVTVDSEGSRGGLALFWKKDIDIRIKSWYIYHIDCVITEDDGIQWRFTGIYGESRSEEKDNTWKTLRTLKEKNDLQWLCSGDFNEILFSCEKEGGPIREERCMQKFRIALEDCDLHDLGFVGDPFTWWNNHHLADSFTKERLDRAVANGAWRFMFPLVQVVNGDPRHSNHIPIIVDVGSRERNEWNGNLEFIPKFEAKWLEED
jgi:exonuclease III